MLLFLTTNMVAVTSPVKGAIDLIHVVRHLCTRLRTDGIKTMSRGFSGGGGGGGANK